MKKPEATGRIRIIKTPRGEAPEEIREAWVGLTLPCWPIAGQLPGSVRGVLSHALVPNEKDCSCTYEHFVVPQAAAIAELALHNAEAASWWNAHGYPRPGRTAEFAFRIDEAEIVSGVVMQSLTEITDEMMGDPNR